MIKYQTLNIYKIKFVENCFRTKIIICRKWISRDIIKYFLFGSFNCNCLVLVLWILFQVDIVFEWEGYHHGYLSPHVNLLGLTYTKVSQGGVPAYPRCSCSCQSRHESQKLIQELIPMHTLSRGLNRQPPPLDFLLMHMIIAR